jgi:hypothetical protein
MARAASTIALRVRRFWLTRPDDSNEGA